jgi:pentatricopeptide repeat protein
MWEMRDEPRHFVHSKVMGWVCLDRALRIAATHRTRTARIRRWSREREGLANEIRDLGFDRARETYVQSYGSSELDASLLLLPALGFEEGSSPRLRSTVAAIRRDLHAGGPLFYRYRTGDGTPREGAFLACSFWMVDALARLGQHDEAASMFAELCERSNDLGLFAEEMDPTSGEHLGNFPQALTHAALLQAAVALDPDGSGLEP